MDSAPAMKNTGDFERQIRNSIEASIATKRAMLADAEIVSSLAKICELLVNTLGQGNKILLFGNGGSAADAQHFAAELVGRFAFDRPALPAIALSVNTSSITAIANDHGFNQVFSRQMEALARPGDVAIGISTSGTSSNVLSAFSTARKMKLHSVALTGKTGGKLKGQVDHCVCVPSNETARIQECHGLIGHILAELVEQAIFNKQGRASRP
jgi:D-sedoheptulose 7-phosphate isomerase